MKDSTHKKLCWVTGAAAFVLCFLGVMAGDTVAVVNILMGMTMFAVGLTVGEAIKRRRGGDDDGR
jgi:hypothetical protein